MLRVGLTGGVASGKSTVSRIFSDLGVPIIDTDVISHRLMLPGEAGYERSVAHFGTDILTNAGHIDRKKLRQIVFRQPAQRRWLEALLHPLIRQQSLIEADSMNDADYALIVVPLMFESGFDAVVQYVITIDCPIETQRRRLMLRDQADEELADRIIQAQTGNDERIARADFVLQNHNEEDLHPQVAALHRHLNTLAKAPVEAKDKPVYFKPDQL